MEATDLASQLVDDAAADDRLAGQFTHVLRSAAIAALYALAVTLLGATTFQAATIAAVIFTCLMIDLAQYAIMRFGLIFIPYAFAVWLKFVPEPAMLWAHVCGRAI